MVLEKTLESCLDSKEFKTVLKEINTEYSLEGLMLKIQYFVQKDPDAGKDWRQKEEVAKDEMVK